MSEIDDVAAYGKPSGSLGDWLTDVLKQRLMQGRYEAGEWIREPALQKEFGLSNGPVREALRNLVATGALVREARRGIRVVQLSDEEVVALLEARLSVLEFAAEIAARRSEDLDFEWVAARMTTIEAAGEKRDLSAFGAGLGEITEWVARAGGNAFLIADWDDLNLMSKIYVSAAFRTADDVDNILVVWRRLVDVIAKGDVNAARATVRKVYRDIFERLGLADRSIVFSRHKEKSANDLDVS